MNSPGQVISRITILILAFVLVNTGLRLRLQPHLSVSCVLTGTAGMLSYVGLKWSEFLRNRATVVRLLTNYGQSLRNARGAGRV